MGQPVEQFGGPPTARPEVIVEWAKARAERDEAFRRQHPEAINQESAPDAWRAKHEADSAAFDAMYAQLSEDERLAERARLQSAAEAEAWEWGPAHLDLLMWDSAVGYWRASHQYELMHHAVERGDIEREAIQLAENVLRDCSYLGGVVGFPNPARRCQLMASLGTRGSLDWQDSTSGLSVCSIAWPDVTDMRVGPTDRSPERYTATRLSLLGPAGLAFKKQRREAMLGVKTTTGEGLFIVRGFAPLELEAQLGPLKACIGIPSSDDFVDATDAYMDEAQRGAIEAAKRERVALMEAIRGGSI